MSYEIRTWGVLNQTRLQIYNKITKKENTLSFLNQ